MSERETNEPAGMLGRFQFSRKRGLSDASTTDLLHELAARFSAAEPYPMTEDGVLAGKLLQDQLRELTDVHLNRFSRKRLRDLHYNYIGRPHHAVRPSIADSVWVEMGCGSQNPVAFLFLALLLGARRGIAVDLDPIQDPVTAWRALADVAAMMLVDPVSIVEHDGVDRLEVMKRLAAFDLAKLRVGDPTGVDPNRLAYFQESVEATSLPAASADVVVSHAFLEHVSNLEAIVRECARITRPGGFGLHGIDGADHWRYSDASVHPLSFLQEGGDATLVHHSNRIRPLAMGAVFEQHGFEVVEFDEWERVDVPPELRARFVEPFRSMAQEDLEVMSGLLVVRRR